MKLFTFIFLLFFCSPECWSQSKNIVPNPGFEKYNQCPTWVGNINYSNSYSLFTWVQDWANPNENTTPDYFNACDLNGIAGVPNNLKGYYPAHTGNAYAGIVGWSKNGIDTIDAEYIEVKLTEPLIKDRIYSVSFYVRNIIGSGTYHSIDRLGASFSNFYYHQTNNAKLLNLPYAISNPSGKQLDDTSKWIEINAQYKAKGKEQFLIIGCFNDGNGIIVTGPQNSVKQAAYYIIDDVFVGIWDTITTNKDIYSCSVDQTIRLKSTISTATYKWSTGAQVEEIEVKDTGTYWCVASNGAQLIIDTFHVKQFKQTYKDSIHTWLCGNALTLDGPTLNAGVYSWSTGQTSASLIVYSPGTYIRKAVADCSLYVSTFNVDDYVTMSSRFDTMVCKNGLRFEKNIRSHSIDAEHYRWSTGDTLSQIKVTDTGLYTVIATYDCTKYYDTFYFKHVIYNEHASLGADTSVCNRKNQTAYTLGQPKQAGTKYMWSTMDTVCCIAPQLYGTYTLTITDGCTYSSDTVKISVTDCDSCILAPDAFTPNSDGLNDVYRIRTACLLSDLQLIIVNRFGQTVFETNDINNGWDGRINGIPQDLNTYYYMVRYKTGNSNEYNIKKGALILIH